MLAEEMADSAADVLLKIINLARGLEIECRELEAAGGAVPDVLEARLAEVHDQLVFAKAEAEGIGVKEIDEIGESDIVQVVSEADGKYYHYHNPAFPWKVRNFCDAATIRKVAIAIRAPGADVKISGGAASVAIDGRIYTAYPREGIAFVNPNQKEI